MYVELANIFVGLLVYDWSKEADVNIFSQCPFETYKFRSRIDYDSETSFFLNVAFQMQQMEQVHLREAGRTWENLREPGRTRENLGESGRGWENQGEPERA